MPPETGHRTLDNPAFHPRDPAAYRAVMGAFPTGVTVMTAGHEGTRVGCTASSFNTVSLDPPLILWSLALRAPSLEIFRAANHFAVNILSATQKDMALHFARGASDKFAGVETFAGETGAPLLSGALAHIECRIWSRTPTGDHEIIVGEVLGLRRCEGAPLVFSAGCFHALTAI